MVGYVKHHFFVRYREFDSLEHLNQLARQWLESEADRRFHGTVKEVVRERFAREAPTLGPLPTVRFDTSYHEQRLVHGDGYIEVRRNRYSVPASLCGTLVAIRLSLDGCLKVISDGTLVTEHWLRSPREGWVTVADHHRELWQNAVKVERRNLSVYKEVIPWN